MIFTGNSIENNRANKSGKLSPTSLKLIGLAGIMKKKCR
jgi:hypothetical protein